MLLSWIVHQMGRGIIVLWSLHNYHCLQHKWMRTRSLISCYFPISRRQTSSLTFLFNKHWQRVSSNHNVNWQSRTIFTAYKSYKGTCYSVRHKCSRRSHGRRILLLVTSIGGRLKYLCSILSIISNWNNKFINIICSYIPYHRRMKLTSIFIRILSVDIYWPRSIILMRLKRPLSSIWIGRNKWRKSILP